LISFDTSKKDIITYALDRMKDPMVLEDEAEVPIDFNPEAYFQDTIGITTYKGKTEKIVLKTNPIAAKYISSQPLHHSQKLISENSDYSVFELKILISEELIRTILSYAGEIEVLEPKSLKEILSERIQQMAAIYLK